MRIMRLTLRNWRTFKNLDIPIGQRLVVIGPNAAGKSNLLDSIRFLRDLTSPGGGLQDAVRSRGGLSRLRCLFARNNHHGWVGITVVIGESNGEDWTYSVSFRSEQRGLHRAVVAQELVKRGEETLLSRPDAEDEADPERLTQTALEQISVNRSFRAIADFFAETRYLHLVPQVIRDASRSGDVADDPFGGDFIARMNRVAPKTRAAWLRQVTAALQIAVPQFSSLEVTVDAAGRPHLESRYTNWRVTGARQDERDLSDGTLRLIGLLWSLVEVGRRGAPVLLEEPELSLHPAVIRMLPTVLARAQRTSRAQVILTTHSPELLADDGIRADEVLLLTPTADGTAGLVLGDDPEAVDLIDSGLTVAEVALPRTEPPNIEGLGGITLGRR
jgi:predicted ATPase